jgi:hypothetical protein
MKAVTKLLAGGVFAASLIAAAPAAAQYPGYYPNNGANVVGQVINQVLGGGYGGYGYGQAGGQQVAIGQCVNAVQARLSQNYGGGYGAYGAYGGNPYGGYAGGYSQARVLGISRVEPRSNGGLTIRGVANSGAAAGYGYNTNQIDLTFRCRVDYRGYIVDVDIDRAQSNYGTNYQPYTPYGNDYSQYGYRRY